MAFPRLSDRRLIDSDELARNPQHSRRQAVILRQLDPGLQPELRVALRRVYVDMHALFLAREKEQSVRAMSQDRRAQDPIVGFNVAGEIAE
jgi:hypothetical protein